jgi:hypothetical protein
MLAITSSLGHVLSQSHSARAFVSFALSSLAALALLVLLLCDSSSSFIHANPDTFFKVTLLYNTMSLESTRITVQESGLLIPFIQLGLHRPRHQLCSHKPFATDNSSTNTYFGQCTAPLANFTSIIRVLVLS